MIENEKEKQGFYIVLQKHTKLSCHFYITSYETLGFSTLPHVIHWSTKIFFSQTSPPCNTMPYFETRKKVSEFFPIVFSRRLALGYHSVVQVSA
jgi:hypothetical protein